MDSRPRVIPAQAGMTKKRKTKKMDSRFRGNDKDKEKDKEKDKDKEKEKDKKKSVGETPTLRALCFSWEQGVGGLRLGSAGQASPLARFIQRAVCSVVAQQGQACRSFLRQDRLEV